MDQITDFLEIVHMNICWTLILDIFMKPATDVLLLFSIFYCFPSVMFWRVFFPGNYYHLGIKRATHIE